MATKTTKTTTKKSSAAPEEVEPKQTPGLVPVKKNAIVKMDMAAIAEGDEGAGSENVRMEDLAIPRIGLIQSNSPQLKKADGKYIKGAEEGDFLDSVSNEVFAKGEEGFLFIPVSYRRANIEWIPRTQGGGFVADHGTDDTIFSKCTKDEETGAMMLPNGHEVITTAEYIGLAINALGVRQVAISLAKTQLKEAKRLNTKLTTLAVPKANGQGTFNPAFFYSTFKVNSIPQNSKKGQSYMGWQLARECDTLELKDGGELYLSARQFQASFKKGEVKVAQPSADVSDIPDGSGDDSL